MIPTLTRPPTCVGETTVHRSVASVWARSSGSVRPAPKTTGTRDTPKKKGSNANLTIWIRRDAGGMVMRERGRAGWCGGMDGINSTNELLLQQQEYTQGMEGSSSGVYSGNFASAQ